MAGELVVSTINGAGFDGGNVVYNPEFTINQRGAASRTATTGYNFDRWYYDGTRLLQGIEGNNLHAGTYVISWEGSSTAAFSLNTAAAASQGSQSYTSVTNGGTITISSVGSNNLWIRFTSDLGNLTKVKVSPGTQASGFVARPYGTELALCQRYTVVYGGDSAYDRISMLDVYGTAASNGVIYPPVTMRATPSLTVNSASNFAVYSRNTITTCTAVALNFSNPKAIAVDVGVASGLTVGSAGQFVTNNTTAARLTLNAEL